MIRRVIQGISWIPDVEEYLEICTKIYMKTNTSVLHLHARSCLGRCPSTCPQSTVWAPRHCFRSLTLIRNKTRVDAATDSLLSEDLRSDETPCKLISVSFLSMYSREIPLKDYLHTGWLDIDAIWCLIAEDLKEIVYCNIFVKTKLSCYAVQNLIYIFLFLCQIYPRPHRPLSSLHSSGGSSWPTCSCCFKWAPPGQLTTRGRTTTTLWTPSSTITNNNGATGEQVIGVKKAICSSRIMRQTKAWI